MLILFRIGKTVQQKWSHLICILLLLHSFPAVGQSASCPPNIDFSFGNFSNWRCFIGNALPSGAIPMFGNPIPITPVPGPPSRIMITAGTATDPYGGFPVVAPGGGLFSMKLGDNSAGAGAERAIYQVHVPAGASDYDFYFKYAAVLDRVHTGPDAPAFTVIAYDSVTGLPLPCASLIVTVAGNPNFFVSPINSGVSYLSWRDGLLKLQGVAGRTVTLEVSSYDCADSRHFGYGYFDMGGCDSFRIRPEYCNLDSGIIRLAAPTGFANYKWYQGPAISGTPIASSASPILAVPAPAGPTFYYCIVTVAGIGCMDTVRSRVISDFSVNATPDFACNFGFSAGLSLNVTASPAGQYSFSWLPDPRLSATNIPNPIASLWGPPNFVATATDANGCFRRDTVRFVNPSFRLNPVPDTTVCFGRPLTLSPVLTPAAAGYAYSWTGRNVGTALSDTTILMPVYLAPKGGLDTLILRVDSGNCFIKDTIRIRTIPNRIYTADTAVCQYTIFYPDVHGDSSFTYTWLPPEGIVPGQEGLQSRLVTSDTTRSYIVVARHPLCPAVIDSITIRVEPLPIVDIGPDLILKCFGVPLDIHPTVMPTWFSNYLYEWRAQPGIDNAQASDIVFSGNSDATLHLTVTTPLGCEGKDAMLVLVDRPIAAELPDSAILYPGTSYNMPLESDAASFVWSPTVGLDNPRAENPTASPTVSTWYIVTASTERGCAVTDSIYLRIAYDDTPIDLPNAFTPGSADNSEFKVLHLGRATLKSFRIYNRWGNKVFETKDIAQGWDGTFNGEQQPVGVYMYSLEVVTNSGRKVYRKGNVTLIR